MEEPFTFMKLAEEKKKKSTLKSSLEGLLPGAGAGVAATFITNPIGQIGNMKSSHPKEFANKSFGQVAKDLYNMKDATTGAKMGIKSFYAGFGTQAMKNALFSGVMFASLPAFKSLIGQSVKTVKKHVPDLPTND